MDYQELLETLNNLSDKRFKDFHSKLMNDESVKIFGVPVPKLRLLAKQYKNNFDELLSFPNEYYEVKFIKVTTLSLQPYEVIIEHLDDMLPLITNWAICDSFLPKAFKKHKEDFLPYIRKYARVDKEFYQRFALKMLLSYYVEPFYLEEIFSIVLEVNTKYYYVHMMVAWLICEVLCKHYDSGKSFLLDQLLDKKTHNKAIQKACESYRISNDEKNFLKGIKR